MVKMSEFTVHKHFGNIISETTLSFIRLILETMHAIIPCRIEIFLCVVANQSLSDS